MLIYSKKVEEKMKLFGTLSNIPSDEDEELTYTDGDGAQVDPPLSLSQSFVDGGNHNIKRVEDDKEIKVFIGDVNVIPGEGSGPVPPTPVSNPYLTFSSNEPFTLKTTYETKSWDGILEYSTDTESWNEWDGVITLGSGSENKLYLRGSNNTVITGTSDDEPYQFPWELNGFNISCEGNIENLLDYQTVAMGEHPEMADYCYNSMFDGCTSLVKAPQLPAIILTEWCYASMFHNCTSLTVTPQLPATTLDMYCYSSMFSGCTALTTAPQLPATTLADSCYSSMFSLCSSLSTVPALPATVLVEGCYRSMFSGCASLTAIPKLTPTTLTDLCYSGMFRNCTSIKLSATQDETYIISYRIPAEGTGTDAYSSLSNMFAGTGGTFASTPEINTTYYLHKDNSVVG